MLTRFRHTALIFAAISAIAGMALPARAAEFNVKPIRVFLNKDTGSTILTVENQGSSVLRLQVRAYTWTNDAKGQPVLAPSDDLIVFPTLVDINPMEHRSIRIGFSGTPGAKELTYRIALDELPSLESQINPQKQIGLEVHTRITVPVFLTPMVAANNVRIDELNVKHGAVSANLSNTGNVHATVSNAEIVGRDASGAKIFDKRVNGWYVLAGQSWQFGTNVASYCSRLKSVSVTITSDLGRFSKTSQTNADDCR